MFVPADADPFQSPVDQSVLTKNIVGVRTYSLFTVHVGKPLSGTIAIPERMGGGGCSQFVSQKRDNIYYKLLSQPRVIPSHRESTRKKEAEVFSRSTSKTRTAGGEGRGEPAM